jgi:uncharacterized protein
LADLVRHTAPIVAELLTGFRGVVVNGPRQAGKSTLVAQVQVGRGPMVTLDDPVQLDLARADPNGFLARLPRQAAIDEFQRGGSPLLLAAKRLLDESQDRGRLLLAGSTRFLTTRRLAETLTGRVGIVDLLPLSAGEIRGIPEHFTDAAFAGADLIEPECESLDRSDYAELIALSRSVPPCLDDEQNEPGETSSRRASCRHSTRLPNPRRNRRQPGRPSLAQLWAAP